MNKQIILTLLAALSLNLACTNRPDSKVTARAIAPGVQGFGAAVSAGKAISVAELVAASDSFKQKNVVVEGKIKAVCAKKGCWMEVASSADAKTAGCRVTFKDYGFFVPTDSFGADVRVEGVVVMKKLSKGEVEHLESEGASFPSKLADGSAQQLSIIATGVELSRKTL